jgi:hypothetical protein
MPKSKEFFSTLKEQGKINNPKFDELIEKLPDFEIDSDAIKAFEDSFMTVDRAATHPDVNRKIRYEVLKPIDRDMEKIIAAISSVDKSTGDRLESLTRDQNAAGHRPPDTYKRIELLSSSLSDVLNKVKTAPAGGDEEIKKELEAKKKYIEELTGKFTSVEKQYGEQLKNTQKDFEEKLHDFKLDSELEKMAGTFTLAEAYDKNRSAINKVILSELKSTNRLRLGSKDGQTAINVLDENGEPRFNGNSPIQINQLLEEKYKPFLKQSNAENSQSTTQQTNTRTATVNGKTNPAIRRGASTTVQQ